MRRTVLVILGALALVALAACGSDGGISIDTPEGEINVDPEGESGSVEFSGPDGEGGSINIGGGEVPDDFPDDIPLPENYEVTTSFSGGDTGGSSGGSVGLSTKDSFDDLVSMYEDSIPDAGFDVVASGTTQSNGVENFTINFEGNGLESSAVFVSSEEFFDDEELRGVTITWAEQ